MIVSYDNIADAIYIRIDLAAKVAKTVEFAPETPELSRIKTRLLQEAVSPSPG